MKGSAILLIVLICSVIAPSYAKATKKHPILQRRSLISLKDDFITPINANAHSTIVKRDDNKNSNETAQKKEEIINDRISPYFGTNPFLDLRPLKQALPFNRNRIIIDKIPMFPNKNLFIVEKPSNKKLQFDNKGIKDDRLLLYHNRNPFLHYIPEPPRKQPHLQSVPLKPPTKIKTVAKPKISLTASILNKSNKIHSNKLRYH